MQLLSRTTLALCLLWLAGSEFASGQITDIGKEGVLGSRDLTPVTVRSNDGETRGVLIQAFGAHGAFRVVPSMAEANFAVTVNPVGAKAASLLISSGSPEQIKYRETLTGDTRRQAILRAIDRAIYKTSGLQGFFAGRLTFVGERTGTKEVYVSDGLFGEVKRLTLDGADIVRPRWTPDGDAILYSSDKSGGFDVYRIDLVRERIEPLVRIANSSNTSARLSPDGSLMALTLTAPGNAELYVGNRLGKQLRNVSNTRGDEAAPCWSPEGSRLVVASSVGGGLQLYTVSPFGGDMRRVPTNVSGYCAEPDWNHYNPNLLAFTVASGSAFQVAVYDFSSGQPAEVVTSERGDAIEPHWLSDGRHLLYTWRKANQRRIVLFDTKTRRSQVISPEALGNVSQASFLPPRL